MATNDEPTVASPSSSFLTMVERWKPIDTLLGGTRALRRAGSEFLPTHKQETPEDYQRRLEASVLFNMTKMVLGSLTGRVFKDPPKLSEDVPDEIKSLMEDVDLEGSHAWTFCREWFREGLAKGMSHVLVEMQQPPQIEASAGAAKVLEATLDDDRRAGLRPYWVRVSPENLIAAYGSIVGGRQVLTHVRIREKSIERSGWGEKEVQRIRVIEPDNWTLYELRKLTNAKEETWVQVEAGVNAFGAIAMVTFYAGREGFMLAEPPLADLAELNITHWQSSSDQRNILTVSRFPILAVAGASSEDAATLTIGPNKWLATTDPNAKWYYVEHTGAAIVSGANDLDRLEKQMADYGAEFMKEAPDNQAGIARVLDSTESTSELAAFARDFGMAIEQAIEFTGRWLKLSGDMGSVIMTVDLGGEAADKASLEALVQARAMRDVSREGFLNEMKRKDVLSEDFDPEADGKLLAAEVADEAAALFAASGGGPGNPNPPSPARVNPLPPAPPAPKPGALPPKPAGPGISHV